MEGGVEVVEEGEGRGAEEVVVTGIEVEGTDVVEESKIVSATGGGWVVWVVSEDEVGVVVEEEEEEEVVEDEEGSEEAAIGGLSECK